MKQQVQTLTATFEGHAVSDHFAGVGKMVERCLATRSSAAGDSVHVINQLLKRLFDNHELSPDSVVKQHLITAGDGKNYCTPMWWRQND